MINYKAEENGVKVIFTEEAYTSKASSLDNGPILSYSKKNYPFFSGKKVKRGLYGWSKGLLNADLNGALNIIKKGKKIYQRNRLSTIIISRVCC
ncbi:MAG: zinc ribbon domain-containing protein [Thermodesulfobacteriota bacterium]|nr:zinc ribbon domain-containing protein [Thermodesulfobacteriota bacterium]